MYIGAPKKKSCLEKNSILKLRMNRIQPSRLKNRRHPLNLKELVVIKHLSFDELSSRSHLRSDAAAV